MKIVEKWLNENTKFEKKEMMGNVYWTAIIEKDEVTIKVNGEKFIQDRKVMIAFGSTYKTYAVTYHYGFNMVKTIGKTTKQKEAVLLLKKILKEVNYLS